MALDVGGLEEVGVIVVARTGAAVDAAGGNDLSGVEHVRVIGHGNDIPAASPRESGVTAAADRPYTG
jgi:hypothetical protein